METLYSSNRLVTLRFLSREIAESVVRTDGVGNSPSIQLRTCGSVRAITNNRGSKCSAGLASQALRLFQVFFLRLQEGTETNGKAAGLPFEPCATGDIAACEML
jgi:hypothetical protein